MSGADVAVAVFVKLIFPLFGPASEVMVADLVEADQRARRCEL